MKIGTIIPCVCIQHEPDSADPCDYGMPRMYVAQSTVPGKQFWYAYCPNCGRGKPGKERTSSYLALKDWNELQIGVWITEFTDFEGYIKCSCPEWRKKYLTEIAEMG